MEKPNHWLIEHSVKTAVGWAVTGILILMLGGVAAAAIWLRDWFAEPVEMSRWQYWLVALASPIIGFVVSVVVIRRFQKSNAAERLVIVAEQERLAQQVVAIEQDRLAQQAIAAEQERLTQQAMMGHTSYTEDTFFGIVWKWAWRSSGDWDRNALTAYCPACGRRMLTHDDYSHITFRCHHCNRQQRIRGSMATISDLVSAEIEFHVTKEENNARGDAPVTAPSVS